MNASEPTGYEIAEADHRQRRMWEPPDPPTATVNGVWEQAPRWGTSNVELADRARHEFEQELAIRERAREIGRARAEEQGLPEQLTIDIWVE